MSMRLVQVALRSSDLDRSAEFWGDLLGAAAPSAMVYVEVPDVHAALERIAHRATVVAEPHAIFTHEDGALGPEGTTEWQAFVSDPDGNTVGLVSFVPVS
jgi:methylmalonyl-CoA/ethylmalonyl-CoA epimerase